jgi:hypothetical protein
MHKLRTRIIFRLLIIFLFANIALGDRIGKEESYVFDMNEFEDFSVYYYLHPEPHKAAIMLKGFINSPLFTGDKSISSHSIDTTAYFFSRIAQSEQCVINDYLDVFKESSHKQRCFVLKVLQVCGNERVFQFFESNLKQGNFPAEKERIEYALQKGIPIGFDPLTRPIREGGDLDFLWWDFMATGKEEPVLKVIETLKDYDSRNRDLFIIASVAEWSLDSCCRKHDRVKQICRQQISQTKGIVREKLEDIVREIDIEKLPQQISAEKMIKAVVRDVTPGEGKTSTKPKTFYRLGSTQWRIEKPSCSTDRLLTIVKEPDIWIIQIPENTGIHFAGPYPLNYFFPMIKTSDGETRLRGLQLGTEVAFMEAKKALKKSVTFENNKCTLYSVDTEGLHVELICRAEKQNPVELTVSEKMKVVSHLRYDEYNNDLEIKSTLFEISSNAGNRKEMYQSTPGLSPFIKDRLPEQLK